MKTKAESSKADKFVNHTDFQRVKGNEKIKRKNCREKLEELVCFRQTSGNFFSIYGFNRDCIMSIYMMRDKTNQTYIFRQDAYVPISERQYKLFKRLQKLGNNQAERIIQRIVHQANYIATMHTILEQEDFKEKSFRVDLWRDKEQPGKREHYYVMTAVERSYKKSQNKK